MNYAEELRRKKLSMAGIDPWEESSRLSKSNIRLLAQNERLADALRLTLTLAEESIHDDRRFRASVISDGRALLARLDSGA